MDTLSRVAASLFDQARVAATVAQDRADPDTLALALSIAILTAQLAERVQANGVLH